MTAINTIPNVTDIERDNDLSNSPEGSLIYVTTFNELQMRKLGGWVSVVESTISSPEQNVYVSNDGNDLTGNGTIAFPYQTIEFALNQITDASQTKPYTIKITTGQYVENNLFLKPYVNLDGGNSKVQVSGSISLDSTYSAGGNLRIYDFGILDVISGMALNFDTLNSPQSIIFMQNCRTFVNTSIEISGSTNLTLFISDDLLGYQVTLNNTASILQNNSLDNVTVTKDNTFPSYGVQLNSTVVNGLFTVNQNSPGIESLVIDTANCLVDGDSNFTCAGPTATLNWNSQGDRLASLNLDGAGLLFITDSLSSIPNLTNGAIYNLRNLSNGLLANYTPINYTPSDGSMYGHLVGIDAELGVASTESLQTAYDNGNIIQLSSERNLTISDSLGDLVFDVVEDGANSNAVMYRKGVITENSAAGPFFELNNSSVGVVGTELGTISVSGLASDSSFKVFEAVNHEVKDASPGNYSVSQFFNTFASGVETKYMEFDGLVNQIEFYKTFDMKGNAIVAAGNINANGLAAVNTVSGQDLTATDTVSGQNVLTDTLNISTSTANTLLATDGFKNVVSTNLVGDVTTSGLTTTLATVNANVGTFGDATNIPQFTVNGKGLITGVSTLPVDFSSVDLQLVYDNSAPGHEILLDTNLKLSSTTNPLNNFEWSTAVGQALFLMRTDQNASIIRMEDNNPTVGTLTRICSLGSSIQYGDYSVEALSVTPAAETSICTLTGLSSGTPIDYLQYDGSTSTVNLPVDTTITTTTPSTSTTTGSLVNSGGFGNAGDAWVGGNINTSGNMSSLSVTTASINGLTPQGGLSSGTSNSAILTASTAEQSILSTTFVGSRLAPANTFSIGDAYVAVLAGNFSAANGDTLTLRLKGGPTGTTVLSSIVIPLNNATGTYFELEIDFVIRAIGAAGVADIVANYDFSYNQASGGNFQGERKCENNNTTFDTTVNNTLDITAQFSSASASNSIETLLSTLGKTF